MPPLNSAFHDVYFRIPRAFGDLPARFGIITACNPFCRVLSHAENARRTFRLESRLKDLSIPVFPVEGGSRDGSHREAGFGVEGVEMDLLRALGREFDQAATFWIADDVITVVPCGEGAKEFVTSIRDRWLGFQGVA